jgi:hypothetical protein
MRIEMHEDKAKWTFPNKAQIERNKALYEARERGRRFADLAQEHGISVERARQIYLRYKEKMQHAPR